MSKNFLYTLAIAHSIVIASEKLPITHYQIIPDELICHIGTSLYPGIQPAEANAFIKSMLFTCKATNKAVYPYIKDPNYTRILINKIGNNRNQNIIASQLTLPGAQLYLNKNRPFYRQILTLHENTIHRFFKEGADPNYFPAKKKPLLFVAAPDCTRVKMLLNHGANPNVKFNNKTLLQLAIEDNLIPLIALLLQYNPWEKCLRHTIILEKSNTFRLIISSTQIRTKELYNAFPSALHHLNTEAIIFLLKAGINPSPYLREAILTLKKYRYQRNRSKEAALLNIIDLMCQHGAWNKNAYRIAHTSKHIPAKVIEFLEIGRTKAIEILLKNK